MSRLLNNINLFGKKRTTDAIPVAQAVANTEAEYFPADNKDVAQAAPVQPTEPVQPTAPVTSPTSIMTREEFLLLPESEQIQLVRQSQNVNQQSSQNVLPNVLPNVLVNRPKTIDDLNAKCATEEGKQSLLTQNLVFYNTIMGAIAAKNKLDYPPAGPVGEYNLKFQNARLKCLLEAIASKNTSAFGLSTPYPLASHGITQQSTLNARALTSKTLGIFKGGSGSRKISKRKTRRAKRKK